MQDIFLTVLLMLVCEPADKDWTLFATDGKEAPCTSTAIPSFARETT